MSAKKTNTKKPVAVKVIKRTRKANALHDKLEKLFTQKGGCTMHDTFNAGFKYPAIQALKMFEKRGYKVNVVKKAGALTVYSATKRGA
jgi:hypothetical protein